LKKSAIAFQIFGARKNKIKITKNTQKLLTMPPRKASPLPVKGNVDIEKARGAEKQQLPKDHFNSSKKELLPSTKNSPTTKV
jgi:hypothetical protein